MKEYFQKGKKYISRESKIARTFIDIRKNHRRLRYIDHISNSLNIDVFDHSKHYAEGNDAFAVILGSGSSINQISQGQWNWINKCTSVGLNFWPYHEFIPNYMLFEIPRIVEKKVQMLNLYSFRRSDYKNTKFIIHDIHRNKINDIESFKQVCKNFYLGKYWCLCDEKKRSILNVRITIYKILISFGIISIPFEVRASLIRAISFCHFLGYKNILLVGIDLNNDIYFWEKNTIRDNQERRAGVHRTSDVSLGEITAGYAIEQVNKNILQKENVNLCITSKSSLLYPELSYFKIPSISV